MKIVCQRCHAAFEIDAQRIPATGLTMRCLQCQQPLRLEGDLPAPARQPAPRPAREQPPPARPERADLPAPKAAPRAAAPRPPAAPPAPFAPIELSDLPGPRAAPSPSKGAAPSSADVIDLADFDRQAEEAAGPLELSVPPTPGGISFASEAARPRPPSGSQLGLTPGPATAPGAGLGLLDLPAPKRSTERGELPAPKTLPDFLDLPAPKALRDFPELPAPKALPDFPELPAPKTLSGLGDLPAPKTQRELAELPAPKGLPELPELPAPRGFAPLTHLPAPKSIVAPPQHPELTDLPTPKAPAGSAGDVRELPPLDMPAGHTALGSGQLELSMEEGDEALALEEIPLATAWPASPGAPPSASAELPIPKRSSARHAAVAPALGGIIDVLAPKEPAGDSAGEEVMSFEPPELDELVPAAKERSAAADPTAADTAPDGDTGKKKPQRLRQRLLWIGGGLGGVIVILGLTSGLLFPDYGFFAINYLSGAYARSQQAQTQLASSRASLRWDTLEGYSRASEGLAQAIEHIASPDEARTLLAQALAATVVRFGPDPTLIGSAERALAAVAEPEEVAAELAKARGVVALAKGDSRRAVDTLRAVSEAEPADFMAALYLGWALERAQQPEQALAAYDRALTAAPELVGALYGQAQLHLRQGRRDQAAAASKRLLAKQADHAGALLLRGRLLLTSEPQQARALLKRVLTLGPRAAKSELSQAQVELGRLFHQEGNNDESRQRLQAAIQIYPKNVTAHAELARLLLAANQLDQAATRLELARQLDPPNLDVALLSARTALAAGKPAKAQSFLETAAQQAPASTEVLFLRGQVAAAENKLAAAADLLTRVITQDPAHHAAYHHLAHVYQSQGKLADAAALLERALEQQGGKSPELLVALAEVLRASAPDRAREQLEQALALAPEMNQALFLLGALFAEQGQLEQAKARLLQLEAKDKSYPNLQQQLAQILLALGEATAAVGHYEQALAAGPPSLALRQQAAVAYLRAGQSKKAYDQATRIMDDDPTSIEARALRAEARLQQAQHDEALVEIQQALNRQRKPEYATLLGQILQARGETAAAIAAYSDAIKLGSTEVEVRLMRGILLVKSGAVKDGLDALRKVVKEQPELARAYLYIGDAYADLGQEDQAVASYRTAVSKDGTLAQAHLRLGQHLFDARRFAPALSHLQAALATVKEGDAWAADAQYLLANIALELGKRPLAKAALTEFLRLAPANSGLRRDAQDKLDRLAR